MSRTSLSSKPPTPERDPAHRFGGIAPSARALPRVLALALATAVMGAGAVTGAGAVATVEPLATGDWLTVTGDPQAAGGDTVQVDPRSEAVAGSPRVHRVRVSRAAVRRSWDGVPYRSYRAQVAFDCATRTGRYLAIDYFTAPLWQGEVSRSVDYSTGEPRPMLFRDMQPNPTLRIVNAACGRS